MPGETRAKPHAICGAKTRSGEPCTQKPMPNGRCKMHGGMSTGRPVTHGRYAKINRPRVADLLEQNRQDANPLDITEELHLLRALVIDYVERYDEQTEALIAWHSSFSDEYRKAYEMWREKTLRIMESGDWKDIEPQGLPEKPDPAAYENKPRQIMDIISVGKFISEITKIVERIEEIQIKKTISVELFQRVTEAMGDRAAKVLEKYAHNTQSERAKAELAELWGAIRFDPERDKWFDKDDKLPN
jgi:hypothetical protein